MTDSVQVFHPGWRFTDSSGVPYSGAKMLFYDANTTTPRTVYSTSDLTSTSLGSTVYTDSGGVPVASSGSSTEVMVYTGSTAYKIKFTTSADAEIFTLDNIKGALDTSTFLTSGSTSTLSHPVASKTSDYTIVAADRAKIINADATGGTFTLTLTSAVTLGDGWFVIVRNTGTANPVKIAASQAISGPWQAVASQTTSFALRPGEGALIGCNGVGFPVPLMAPALLAGTVGVIAVTDRVSAAPSSPVPGARYIVSGAFSTYEQEDVIEADGAGGFFEITPPTDCGWLAFVQDEELFYMFSDSGWVPLAATQAQMEAASATAVFVTPGRQHFHQSAAKSWAQMTVGGVATVSYNVASVADGGTGIATPSIGTDFSTADWASLVSSKFSTADGACNTSTKAAGTLIIDTWNQGGTLADHDNTSFAGFGDFA